MKPSQGDAVKFTDRFLTNSTLPWTSALKDIELLVARLKIKTLSPFKIYTVYLMVNNMMYKVEINDTGQFVDGTTSTNWIVFEPFHDPANASVTAGAPLDPQQVPVSTPAWTPNAPAQPFNPATEEEANTNCPECGSPAIDMLFRVKCVNSNCKNYR